MENRRFTDTELPVFSGGEGWYRHIHIVQAIVKRALDVALLLKKKNGSHGQGWCKDWRHITSLQAGWRG